jgi:hypothetical protein
MMFFNKKNNLPNLYHAQDIKPIKSWLMCNALIGAKDYAELGRPISFSSEVAPHWYTELKDETTLQVVWDKQDEYLKELLAWIETKEIIEVHFNGAVQNDEKWFKKKYKFEDDSDALEWVHELIDDLPRVNVQYLFIRTTNNTKLIAYESWDTIFVDDVDNELPAKLKEAYSLCL